jgi:hypothetical protein
LRLRQGEAAGERTQVGLGYLMPPEWLSDRTGGTWWGRAGVSADNPPGNALPMPTLPPPPPSDERPDTPFTLALLGGLFITIAGAVEIYAAFMLTFFFSPGAVAPPVNGTLLFFGIVGCGLGSLVIVFAALLYTSPDHRTIYGIVVVVLSGISLVSYYGGFLIGFVLGAVGGVLAIVWRPRRYPGPVPIYAPPPGRVCLKCGRVVMWDMKFCPTCANPLA